MHTTAPATDARPSRPSHTALTLIDSRAVADELRGEPQWQEEGRVSRTLLREPALRIVVTLLRDDAELGADVSDNWGHLEVVEGAARVEAGGEHLELAAGQGAAVAPGSWTLTATQEPTLVVSTFSPSGPGAA